MVDCKKCKNKNRLYSPDHDMSYCDDCVHGKTLVDNFEKRTSKKDPFNGF